MKRITIAVIAVVVVLAISAPLLAVSSFSTQASSRNLFHASLLGSSPNVIIDGIPSGGAPWVVDFGQSGLSTNGVLHLTVVGLVLSIPGSPLDGTTGPVKSVFASLVCQGTGTVAANTSAVPLSTKGNAHIEQRITLPTSCVGPIILVRISGLVSSDPWIASTGFVLSG